MMGRRREGWTAAKRAAFLDALAESCNVKRSCDAAGVVTSEAYRLKRCDAGFAEAWQAALAEGYARVEERLIRDALGEAGGDETGAPPMDKYEREQGLNLLKFHHAAVHGTVAKPHSGGTPPRRATEEETDAAILRHLAALKRRLGA